MFKSKKEKLPPEPEYFLSATNQMLLNYKVYNFSQKEKIGYFSLAFVVGALVAYLFYGGIGKDAYGDSTVVTYVCNVVIMCLVGFFAGKLFLPIRKEQIIRKRSKLLHSQFIDLLDSLSASLASGQNVPSAFISAKNDLLVQHAEDSYIIIEVNEIIEGFNNNIAIEDMLVDFGNRSGIVDISNFGRVFETAYRKGGNIKDIVRNTHEILSTKTLMELEIDTKVASGKNEQNIMLLMPLIIVFMIKRMGGDFASNFTTPTGLIFTTIGVSLFVVSYFLGKKILSIEV